jgi:voltage-gated potassium channel
MEMVAVASAARAAEVAAQAAHDLQDRMLQDARSAELRIDSWPRVAAKGGVRLQARRCCRWFFGTVPRKFGLRRRVEIMLSLTPIGHAWDLVQSILSVVSCTFYVLATYSIDVPVWLDLAITALFLLDYILRWYAAQSRWKYPFSFFAVVDFLTILPVVLQTVVPLLIPSFALVGAPALIGLYFLRMVRVIRIVRILRVFKLVSFFNDEVNRLLVVFGLTVLSIVFISAGAIYTVEMELFALFDEHGRPREHADTDADPITFVDAMYFIVVTISTTGYGDIIIGTWFGRFVVGVIIMLSLVIIPVELGKIRGLLLQRSVYLTSFTPSARAENRHVIVAGNVTNAPMLRGFFAEFYHPDRATVRSGDADAKVGFLLCTVYILRESCSQFDFLPLTYLTRTRRWRRKMRGRAALPPRGRGTAIERTAAAAAAMTTMRSRMTRSTPVAAKRP